jgi:hypothetical protein
MKKITLAAFVLGAGVLPATMFGETGSMTVTATVLGSLGITITSDGAGLALTGSGSTSTTAALGNIKAYGALATAGVTRTRTGETSANYSTPFTFRVVKANTSSADYTLLATLGAAATGHSVLINAVDITDGSPGSIASNGVYSSDVSHTLNLLVLHSSVAPTVNDAVTLTVTAN